MIAGTVCMILATCLLFTPTALRLRADKRANRKAQTMTVVSTFNLSRDTAARTADLVSRGFDPAYARRRAESESLQACIDDMTRAVAPTNDTASLVQDTYDDGNGAQIAAVSPFEVEAWAGDCDCISSWYGPCEAHATTVVSRDGSSLRTGDELGLCYVEDAEALGYVVSGDDRAWLDGLAWNGSWLANPDDAQALLDFTITVTVAVACLPGHNYRTYWYDGYVIYDLHADCPLLGPDEPDDSCHCGHPDCGAC